LTCGELFVAGEALYEAEAFTKKLTKEQIAQSVDPQYIEQFLQTGCS